MTNLNVEGLKTEIERVDDIPLLYGLLEQMGVQGIIDRVIQPHGNWQGLSPGWVMTIWLMHILSEQNHLMEPVQEWTSKHLTTLRRLTGQAVAALDLSDDRLALCLSYVQEQAIWTTIEELLGQRMIRVYDLETTRLRLDATVGTVSHNPAEHALFQVGKAKNGQYATQFKVALASLDPLGLPIVCDVVAGNRADDPLYIPSYQRAKAVLNRSGVLVVGDSKMSALGTLATIVAGDDAYLTPLADQKDAPGLLATLLAPWQTSEAAATRIFLPEDLPADGGAPDPAVAIAHGFESQRERQAQVAGQTVNWQERLLVVRSYSYVATEQAALQRRLAQAEAALCALTPPRQRGKQQFAEEASLVAAIQQIEQKYRVQGLFDLTYAPEVTERMVRGYGDTPARSERQVRYQLTVARNADAIAAAEFKAGWRIYATNAPPQELSLTQAVLAYRDQIIAENVFRRLHGKFLSITPLYIQRDDHAKGLCHLLTIGARVLALGDFLAKRALATEHSQLAGIYTGNPKRATARPTMERMLQAFEDIHLLIFPLQPAPLAYLNELTPVQERILTLLGLPCSLYTNLQSR